MSRLLLAAGLLTALGMPATASADLIVGMGGGGVVGPHLTEPFYLPPPFPTPPMFEHDLPRPSPPPPIWAPVMFDAYFTPPGRPYFAPPDRAYFRPNCDWYYPENPGD